MSEYRLRYRGPLSSAGDLGYGVYEHATSSFLTLFTPRKTCKLFRGPEHGHLRAARGSRLGHPRVSRLRVTMMAQYMNPLAPPMRRRSAPGLSDGQAGLRPPGAPASSRILRPTWAFGASPSHDLCKLDPAILTEGLAAPEPPPRKKRPSAPASPSPNQPSVTASARSSESESPSPNVTPNKHSGTLSPMPRGGLFLQDASWMIADADPYSRTPAPRAPNGGSQSTGAS